MNPPDVAVDLSIFELFKNAHIVVKLVMIGLLLASVWSWAIILEKLFLYAKTRKETDKFEQVFWSGQSLEELYQALSQRRNTGMAALFVAAMRELGRTRRRDGAYRWGLFRDVADSRRFVETFLVESWLEHLRQHRRGTVADRELLDRIQSFHEGPEPPAVSHLLGEARLAGLLEPNPDRPPSRWRHPFRRI